MVPLQCLNLLVAVKEIDAKPKSAVWVVVHTLRLTDQSKTQIKVSKNEIIKHILLKTVREMVFWKEKVKMEESKQTFTSFSDKWHQNKTLAFSETLREGSDIFNWIITRNGFSCSEDFSKYLSSKSHILDAGCGNGRVTALLHSYAPCEANLVGIDLTAAEVAAENLNHLDRVSVSQKDLLDDLSDLGTFDFIYCQEVLHHTTSKKAFKPL